MKKRIGSFLLAAAMVICMLACIPATPVQAANKTITLIKGEQIYWTDYGTVKSVKVSNSKVFSAKKDSEDNKHVNITAKKAGTATMTVKTSYGTSTKKIKVVKADFTVKAVGINSSYVIFKVTNNTSVSIESGKIEYTLVNDNGEVVERDQASFRYLGPGKSAFSTAYYYSSDGTIDYTACSGKVLTEEIYRSYTATYKDISSKVKAELKDENTEAGTYYTKTTLSVKVKNTYSDRANVVNVYAIFYDADGQIVDVQTSTGYNMEKNEITTETMTTYTDFDHYELVPRAYHEYY